MVEMQRFHSFRFVFGSFVFSAFCVCAFSFCAFYVLPVFEFSFAICVCVLTSSLRMRFDGGVLNLHQIEALLSLQSTAWLPSALRWPWHYQGLHVLRLVLCVFVFAFWDSVLWRLRFKLRSVFAFRFDKPSKLGM